MATRDVKNIKKDYLICPLCLDTYTEPKVLPCEHSFCRTCLEAHIRESGVINNQFQCPVDRKPVPVENLTPQQLASSFPDSVFLKELWDLIEEDHRRAQTTCRAHGNKPKEFVCMTCGEIICGHCVVLDHNPKRCDTRTFDQVAANLQQHFKQVKTKLGDQLKYLQKNPRLRSISLLQYNDQIGEIEKSCKDSFKCILETATSIKSIPKKVVQNRRTFEKEIKDASEKLNINAAEETPHESLNRVFTAQTKIEMFEESIRQLVNQADTLDMIKNVVDDYKDFLKYMSDFNSRVQRKLSDMKY